MCDGMLEYDRGRWVKRSYGQQRVAALVSATTLIRGACAGKRRGSNKSRESKSGNDGESHVEAKAVKVLGINLEVDGQAKRIGGEDELCYILEMLLEF